MPRPALDRAWGAVPKGENTVAPYMIHSMINTRNLFLELLFCYIVLRLGVVLVDWSWVDPGVRVIRQISAIKMSYCRKEGKDQIIFVTEEDHKLPEPEETPAAADKDSDGVPEGAVLPNGEINWDCPCLGDMPHGPCGDEFRAAFSCFIASSEEPKGSDCMNHFLSMTECTRRFPDLYPEETAETADTSEPEQQPSTSQPIDQQQSASQPVNDQSVSQPVSDQSASQQ